MQRAFLIYGIFLAELYSLKPAPTAEVSRSTQCCSLLFMTWWECHWRFFTIEHGSPSSSSSTLSLFLQLMQIKWDHFKSVDDVYIIKVFTKKTTGQTIDGNLLFTFASDASWLFKATVPLSSSEECSLATLNSRESCWLDRRRLSFSVRCNLEEYECHWT